jgi:hypothetical protein
MTEEQLQSQIDELRETLKKFQQNLPVTDHQHNGFDATKVEYDDLNGKKLYISHTIYGTGAATAANYGVFFIVPMTCIITSFQEVHQTAGNDAGAVTLNLEKLTGTTAADSGAEILGTALSLKATADTVQTGVFIATVANRSLAKGDRLCLKDAGTLTNVANVTVKVELTVV